jgi:hypothetical protein
LGFQQIILKQYFCYHQIFLTDDTSEVEMLSICETTCAKDVTDPLSRDSSPIDSRTPAPESTLRSAEAISCVLARFTSVSVTDRERRVRTADSTACKKKKKKNKSNASLLIFLDEIDWSTYRCF